jgi:hypothetical protein
MTRSPRLGHASHVRDMGVWQFQLKGRDGVWRETGTLYACARCGALESEPCRRVSIEVVR